MGDSVPLYPKKGYGLGLEGITELKRIGKAGLFAGHKFKDRDYTGKQQWIGLKDGVWKLVGYPFVHICVNHDERITEFKQWQRPDSPLSVLEVRHMYIHTAMLIVHEFAHAVAKYLWADRKEPFFGDGNVAELGFAYESFIFGGHILSAYDAEVLVQDWPNKVTIETYNMIRQFLPSDGSLPDQVTVARADETRIERMFSPDFWQAEQRESLRMPLCCTLASEELDLRHEDLGIKVREPSEEQKAIFGFFAQSPPSG